MVVDAWSDTACVALFLIRTKRLGLILKILLLLLLPVPLILWPFVGIFGSLLGAAGYGVFAPLIATFEAVGENVADKFYHCSAVSMDMSGHSGWLVSLPYGSYHRHTM